MRGAGQQRSCWSVAVPMNKHPQRRDQDYLRLFLRTARPPPWRIAPSRTLLFGPTTCQTRTSRHHVRFAIALRTAPNSLQ
jgi:hypothetical protein